MPRYFFHTRDGHAFHDEDGTELPNPRSAREHGVTIAGELLKGQSARFGSGSEWEMKVTDEGGSTLCRITFTVRCDP